MVGMDRQELTVTDVVQEGALAKITFAQKYLM